MAACLREGALPAPPRLAGPSCGPEPACGVGAQQLGAGGVGGGGSGSCAPQPRWGRQEDPACAVVERVFGAADATFCTSRGALRQDIAHVVVMPNVDLPKLEQFVTEYIASRARSATVAALDIAAKARELDATADK